MKSYKACAVSWLSSRPQRSSSPATLSRAIVVIDEPQASQVKANAQSLQYTARSPADSFYPASSLAQTLCKLIARHAHATPCAPHLLSLDSESLDYSDDAIPPSRGVSGLAWPGLDTILFFCPFCRRRDGESDLQQRG